MHDYQTIGHAKAVTSINYPLVGERVFEVSYDSLHFDYLSGNGAFMCFCYALFYDYAALPIYAGSGSRLNVSQRTI